MVQITSNSRVLIKMTPSFALKLTISQISKMVQFYLSKMGSCTLFLPDFRPVFETGSVIKLNIIMKRWKFLRYTVPEKRGRHRHGRCSHPLVASASG